MNFNSEEFSVWKNQVDQRLDMLESKPKQELSSPNTAINMGDFLRSKNPQTTFERAIIIAYYLEKIEGCSPFTMDQIRQGFIQCKEPIPGNPSDIIYQAIKRSLMMKTAAKKKDNFYQLILTNAGEKFVEGMNLAEAS